MAMVYRSNYNRLYIYRGLYGYGRPTLDLHRPSKELSLLLDIKLILAAFPKLSPRSKLSRPNK